MATKPNAVPVSTSTGTQAASTSGAFDGVAETCSFHPCNRFAGSAGATRVRPARCRTVQPARLIRSSSSTTRSAGSRRPDHPALLAGARVRPRTGMARPELRLAVADDSGVIGLPS
ncbi:hypothetical protein [Plantactinospora sp. KLBMP9567]|uniref:hypothetical protein n=1 Tax=Plantactinospora sp. KLBMP9567 TaxID=3085900 RepID=UPI0029816614|nr:hypothetical protein [Plantactinospora sp. KLBMP9567]MDW5330080.1 hypothetical protein [Plantactinospora sp. KLBMP9567]